MDITRENLLALNEEINLLLLYRDCAIPVKTSPLGYIGNIKARFKEKSGIPTEKQTLRNTISPYLSDRKTVNFYRLRDRSVLTVTDDITPLNQSQITQRLTLIAMAKKIIVRIILLPDNCVCRLNVDSSDSFYDIQRKVSHYLGLKLDKFCIFCLKDPPKVPIPSLKELCGKVIVENSLLEDKNDKHLYPSEVLNFLDKSDFGIVRSLSDVFAKCVIPMESSFLAERELVHNCPLYLHIFENFKVTVKTNAFCQKILVNTYMTISHLKLKVREDLGLFPIELKLGDRTFEDSEFLWDIGFSESDKILIEEVDPSLVFGITITCNTHGSVLLSVYSEMSIALLKLLYLKTIGLPYYVGCELSFRGGPLKENFMVGFYDIYPGVELAAFC